MRTNGRPVTNWSDEETGEPLLADHRNFYKVEKWSNDGLRWFAGLIKVPTPAEAVFCARVRRPPLLGFWGQACDK